MKVGDQLKSVNGETVVVMDAPDPPAKWTIQYVNGKRRMKSKSFLKKYFEVVNAL